MEVHAVISQYIIDCMKSEEARNLFYIVFQNVGSVIDGLTLTFQQSYGVHVPSSQLPIVNYLTYRLSEIENVWLPCYLKTITIVQLLTLILLY